MNYEEALNYINDKDKYGSRLGLDSVGMLLKNLGNPHKGMNYIHVGGTNGKGSISSYLSEILISSGYKTGLYTSPYLERFTERIQINGVDIPDESLARITEKVKEAADKMVKDGFLHPTTFEIVTAIGFVYFEEVGTDVIVLEVGLGGRYDSTNIIDSSLASIITTIDYDHMDVLGNTLPEIAFQKAGIIKENGLVIAYPQREETRKVFMDVSQEMNAQYVELGLEDVIVKEETDYGSRFDFKFGDKLFNDLEISMLGDYQVYNAATAILCVLNLRERKLLSISDEDIYKGISLARWKGRLEVLGRAPVFLIDGAHNLQGVENLVKSLSLFRYKRLILGIGVLKDKDYSHMVEKLAPMADDIIVTEVKMPRKLVADDLASEIKKYNQNVHIETSVGKAVKKAIEIADEDDMILFGGSLYLIGEVRSIAKALLN